MALRSITGKVEDIAFKLSGNGNEFCTISFLEKRENGGWNQYPYNCRTFDEEIVEALKEEVEENENGLKGTEGVLRVDVKQDREYQGKPVTDRDIIDYDFSGKIREWTRTADFKDEVRPPQPTTAAQSTGTSDPRQASIERQVAFKEAVSIVARMNPTAETGWWDSIFLATNMGESILNRTYGQENLGEKLAEWLKLIGQGAAPEGDEEPDGAETKEPDDEADQQELF